MLGILLNIYKSFAMPCPERLLVGSLEVVRGYAACPRPSEATPISASPGSAGCSPDRDGYAARGATQTEDPVEEAPLGTRCPAVGILHVAVAGIIPRYRRCAAEVQLAVELSIPTINIAIRSSTAMRLGRFSCGVDASVNMDNIASHANQVGQVREHASIWW